MPKPAICGIYKIVSPSGSFYIGSSVNVKDRWSGHKGELRRGRHHCQPLQRAADKYGVEALRMTVIVECEPNVLRQLEQLAIDYLSPEYNSSQSTLEPLTNLWKDPDFRARNIESSSARLSAIWLRPGFAEQHRVSSAIRLRELHKNPEFKLQHAARASSRLARLINSNPAVRQKAIDSRNAMYEASPEAQQARSDRARKLMQQLHGNPDVKKRMAAGSRDRMKAMRADPERIANNLASVKAALSKAILCVETGQTFPSITDAVVWLGMTPRQSAHLGTVLKRPNKKAYGYTWQYVESESLNVPDGSHEGHHERAARII